MSDIEAAKQLLNEGFTCVLCRGSEVYKSSKRGVAPMMEWLESGTELNGFSAADKVVGKAAAMLFVLAGVSEVYGVIMSKAAAKFLMENKIPIRFEALTEHIVNRSGDGICPMEQLTSTINQPAEAFAAIRQKLIELRKE